MNEYILSHVWVTVDGVWIYWTFLHIAHDCTSQLSATHIHWHPQSRLHCHCSVVVCRLPLGSLTLPLLQLQQLQQPRCFPHFANHYSTCHFSTRRNARLTYGDCRFTTYLMSKSHYDRQSVAQSVLVSGSHLGHATNFSFSLKFSLDSCGLVIL
jgi:hypothetical protein